MANPDNLIPMKDRSPSEAREMGKKGGIASGKARRKKAEIKKLLEIMLNMELPNNKLRQQIEAAGLDPTYQTGVALSALTKAIETGSMKDLLHLAKLLGQDKTPADKAEQAARIDLLKANAELKRQQAAKADGTDLETTITQQQAIADLINNPVAVRDINDYLPGLPSTEL